MVAKIQPRVVDSLGGDGPEPEIAEVIVVGGGDGQL
jgi:hypothetical protein